MLRHLGTAIDYPQLHQLLRDRRTELGISFETLNAVSGLTYCDKLLAPMPVGGAPAANGRRTPRGIGPVALGPLLQALGLVLIVAEDPAATERLKRRQSWSKRNEAYVNAHAKALGIDQLLTDRMRRIAQETGAIGGKRRLETMSREARQRSARKAAKLRWQIERKARKIAKRIERAMAHTCLLSCIESIDEHQDHDDGDQLGEGDGLSHGKRSCGPASDGRRRSG